MLGPVPGRTWGMFMVPHRRCRKEEAAQGSAAHNSSPVVTKPARQAGDRQSVGRNSHERRVRQAQVLQ